MSASICTNSSWFSQNITTVEELDNLSNDAYELRMKSGRRHMPVKHSTILTKFREKAAELNLKLTNEVGKLKTNGERFMYTADIVDETHPDFALSIGYENRNDLTKSFQGLLGSHVFMCCNGVCHGVIQPSRIRHTRGNVENGLVLGKVDVIFDRFIDERGDVTNQIDLLKTTPLTDRLLGDFILEVTRAKRIGNKNILELVNLCDNPEQMIVNEVENPTLNSKDDTSAFRLLNACSYVSTHRIKNPNTQVSTSKFLNDTLLKLIKPDMKLVGDIVEAEEVVAE